ncbi:MAG: acetyl/propionyl/methylcrotonyl-CoA carboxylase subunit alpha [Arenicellales bacterium]
MGLFKKILIANRGEIACRAMRTAQKMGIATVAVYSDADKRAKHVREADEALYLGGNAPSESYLNIDKIIAACQTTGADAVYPGYGFLSENAEFAKRLAAENITFIGPNVRAIEAMGDKITSKIIAEKAGVNVIPGHTAVLKDAEEAVTLANQFGYPVMLKASAGGGGKGMRVAYNDEECRDGFARAASESLSSFGDDRMFIEKYIEQPRHIEIQLIADTHGNVLTLNERECSIQRRHQKVIEEAPSPFIDDATRKAMSEQAVLLAKAVDYVSAGTVELIVDTQQNFFFLEMNTRLQVEHPVTEMITGLDLIELMIRAAAGEKLPLQQSEVKRDGWAIEARVYAENPSRNFVPSIGRLKRYVEPNNENQTVRVDAGIDEGDEISMFYDPMISKLITHAPTRDEAIDAMQLALDQYTIQGVETNIGFLSSILQQPRFIKGELDTDFIADLYPDGYDATLNAPDTLDALIPLLVLIHYRYSLRASELTGQLPHHTYTVSRNWVAVDQHDVHHDVEICQTDDQIRLEYQGQHYFIEDSWTLGEPRYTGNINGRTISAQIRREQYHYVLSHKGYRLDARVLTPNIAALSRLMPPKKEIDLSKFLLSPMPGLLINLDLKVGDKIHAGSELAVIEAMKMENSIRADEDCIIKAVFCKAGDVLEVDQKIIEFE